MRFLFFFIILFCLALNIEFYCQTQEGYLKKYYFTALNYFHCVLKQGALYIDETNYRLFQLKKITLQEILTLVITGKNIYSHASIGSCICLIYQLLP